MYGMCLFMHGANLTSKPGEHERELSLTCALCGLYTCFSEGPYPRSGGKRALPDAVTVVGAVRNTLIGQNQHRVRTARYNATEVT